MLELSRSFRKTLFGTGLLLGTVAAQAGFIVSVQDQAPKSPLTDPAPPAFSAAMQAAINAFRSDVATTGGNEVEDAIPRANFSYGTTGVATASGGLAVIDGAAASTDFSVGRYNTTRGLPPAVDGSANPGHWLEAASSFGYAFSGEALSAFSFLGTDFGDFGGQVRVEIFRGGVTMFSYDFVLSNDPGSNGSLTFFGIKGNTVDDQFDSVMFTVQSPGGGDALGIDSLSVGRVTTAGPGPNPVPEPGSLVLAGLALAAAAGVAKRRKAR